MNSIQRMKELIAKITEADTAYYRDDSPVMTDREYDALLAELLKLEQETGIVFGNSPSKRVAGQNSEALEKVKHTKPMLSAKKTKSVEDLLTFKGSQRILLSWKLDGLTLVLRYRGGKFTRAITRGEEGLIGEDVTHTVKHMRGIPQTVRRKDDFEVRGEGVISWLDFEIAGRRNEETHPRNVAAGAVRSLVPDSGLLSHMDFIAFELIDPMDRSCTKEEQLDTLTILGFRTVERAALSEDSGEEDLRKAVKGFDPEKYSYPVDGIIAEYDDLDYGRSLGATAHHENRMIALKWEDELHETVFRKVELATTRTGLIALTAVFDPVRIDGATVRRADLHSLSNFEKMRLGEGDTVRVYKANMIIPQIAENVTKSGTYRLPDRCPACGEKLTLRTSAGGSRNLYCPNESCIARNAQKIARFCDRDAMNLDGFNASVVEKLMEAGFIKNFADLYHLSEKRESLMNTRGFGIDSVSRMIRAAEKSRKTTLQRFLTAVGIPMLGSSHAKAIDEYFYGSFVRFEQAIKEGFCFFHIEGVTEAVSRQIYKWYENEAEEKLWRPVLQEVTFDDRSAEVYGKKGLYKPFGKAFRELAEDMDEADLEDLLNSFGLLIGKISEKCPGKLEMLKKAFDAG